MTAKEKAKALIAYLQSLPGFELVERESYDHMGAIITDTMLQAGVSYNAVRMRRDKVRGHVRGHEEARTTSGFLSLLDRQSSVGEFLEWGGRKPRWVLGLAGFLRDEGVETKGDLQAWLEVARNRDSLLILEGIGPKTRDYLLKLADVGGVAIDRRWERCLKAAGIAYRDYEDAKLIVELAADGMGVSPSALDTSVWRHFGRSEGDGCAS